MPGSACRCRVGQLHRTAPAGRGRESPALRAALDPAPSHQPVSFLPPQAPKGGSGPGFAASVQEKSPLE